jgi:hypothetical protein
LKVGDIKPTKYDAPLLERGLHPLACYFQLWRNHNSQVLETVSSERLLIVETQHLIESIPTMAEWLEIRADTLKPDRGWLFATPKKYGTLATLDADYVRETADSCCGTLMQKYFPDTSLHTVLGRQKARSVSVP